MGDQHFRLGAVSGPSGYPDLPGCVSHAYKRPAQGRIVQVHGDGVDLGQNAARIGQGIDKGIENNGADHDQQNAFISEYPVQLGQKVMNEGHHGRPQL